MIATIFFGLVACFFFAAAFGVLEALLSLLFWVPMFIITWIRYWFAPNYYRPQELSQSSKIPNYALFDDGRLIDMDKIDIK